MTDALKAADDRKVIADWARWHSDERHRVRDDVPASAEWARLAPQREAEWMRLEEKRRAAMNAVTDQ